MGKPLRVVDLFAGIGGMSLGTFLAARELGRRFELILAVEADPAIGTIYRENFVRFARGQRDSICIAPVQTMINGRLGSRFSPEDRQIVAQCGKVDLLVGGPPCQGNSDLNNHTRRNDDRNPLYDRMARAAEILRPTAIIVENVPAVIHDKGQVVNRAQQALQDAGYSVAHTVLSLKWLGVPQRRKRHVMIGLYKAQQSLLQALIEVLTETRLESPRVVKWAIGDLARTPAQGGGTGFDSAPIPSGDNEHRLAWLQRNPQQWILPNSERPACHRNGGHTYKTVYGRMRWDHPAQTITTGFGSMGQGCFVHPNARRTITPHEAARLQTFPDFFDFGPSSKRTTWAHGIGNAVPPLAMREVVKVVICADSLLAQGRICNTD